ncbi:MAG TPA: TlpA disulfide reductase family protein [Chitinophagaceae bacterium]|nr:TlpA disulfide reductase family protein [Chitinophagaceae bacterium]
MKFFKFNVLFILVPFISFPQSKTFEIFGSITGEYHSKIYIFFDNNFRQRDSISSEIKNGKFYFRGTTTMPIQARLHMDQQSYIGDIYIDNTRTYVACTTKMKISNNGQDTMNMLSVVKVRGSATDNLKSGFETWLQNLEKSKVSDEEKREAWYQKLATFIKRYPKSKVSPYLLSNAYELSYSQVKELSKLIDTSLSNTFEFKSVLSLLNQLDKSKNSAIGATFQDFVLPDSSGVLIDTKQFRGKYTLIVCWASWCKPCREEHPDLNTLYEKFKNNKFEMIGVSLDKDKEKWKQAIIKDQLSWKQVIDPNAFDGELAKYYDIEAIPANFLLDKEGKIIGVGLTAKEIQTMIEKAL